MHFSDVLKRIGNGQPIKPRRALWIAAQATTPVTGTQTATTSDNACTAILWRLAGMLRHVSC
ncbi:hypothetical protein EDC15_12736 [Acetobacter aceti NBRC 14818]|nr:hypothetical protein EDC15_12736 [Acetobacter aceti NBRC 14818]